MKGTNFLDRLEKIKKEIESSSREYEVDQLRLIQSEKCVYASFLATFLAQNLRNPLSIIKITLENFYRKIEDEDSLEKYREMIIKNVNKIDSLAKKFVDTTQIPKITLEPINVNETLEELLQSVDERFNKQNIEVVKEFNCKNPRLKADRGYLERAFLNMLFNSIEAMPEGGEFIAISSDGGEKYIKVVFADTGVGIKKKNITRIFDPFFSDKKEGAGLGLTRTYKIIQAHGGSIDVESVKGEGSIFTVHLPKPEDEPR